MVELSSTDAHQEEANFRWVLSETGTLTNKAAG